MRSKTNVADIFSNEPHLLTNRRFREITGLGRHSVEVLIEKGELEAIKPTLSGDRGSVRILRSSAEDLLTRWLEESESGQTKSRPTIKDLETQFPSSKGDS